MCLWQCFLETLCVCLLIQKHRFQLLPLRPNTVLGLINNDHSLRIGKVVQSTTGSWIWRKMSSLLRSAWHNLKSLILEICYCMKFCMPSSDELERNQLLSPCSCLICVAGMFNMDVLHFGIGPLFKLMLGWHWLEI